MLPMRDGQSTSEDRATQLLICEPLSFAIIEINTKLIILVFYRQPVILCLGALLGPRETRKKLLIFVDCGPNYWSLIIEGLHKKTRKKRPGWPKLLTPSLPSPPFGHLFVIISRQVVIFGVLLPFHKGKDSHKWFWSVCEGDNPLPPFPFWSAWLLFPILFLTFL